MKRYYTLFKGRVQGVGFRYQVFMIAQRLKITGIIKNLYSGDVEMEAQGENVDKFIDEILKLKGFIRIDDYAIKEIAVKEEKEFSVKY